MNKMTLGDLQKAVNTAVEAYGRNAKFIVEDEDRESPVIEIDIHPSPDSNKSGAPVVISFNTTEIINEEW